MKFNFKKNNRVNFKRGMTYIELVVVISIFFVMSAVVLTKNDNLQKKIEIQNLSNQIALKIVQAQKDSLSGLNAPIFAENTCTDMNNNSVECKPSYGVYFNTADPFVFSYFSDKDNNNISDDMTDDSININKGNFIKEIKVFGDICSGSHQELYVVFRRPSSGPRISIGDDLTCVVSEAQITLSSSDSSIKSTINVYSSGRVQIN